MHKEEALLLALQLADENRRRGGELYGAVLLRDGVIVATGVNDTAAACDPTAHAEIQAIRHAGRSLQTTDLSGCELYASDEPCPMCMAAIKWSGIRHVFYVRPAALQFSKEWSELKVHTLQLTSSALKGSDF